MTLPDAPLPVAQLVRLRRSVTGKARENGFDQPPPQGRNRCPPSGKERMQWRWSGNTTQALDGEG